MTALFWIFSLQLTLAQSLFTARDYPWLVAAAVQSSTQALEQRAALYLVTHTTPIAASLPHNPTAKQASHAPIRSGFMWPVSGTLVTRYGTPMLDSSFRHEHVVIETEEKEVRASHAGTVRYAQWVPNIGLTLIIEHAGEIQSIYGQCDRLYVKEGDQVQQGQAIASFSGPTPYFLFFSMKQAQLWVNPSSLMAEPLSKKQKNHA